MLASSHHADVAELADALDSGSSGVTPVEVQVLSAAPLFPKPQLITLSGGITLFLFGNLENGPK